MLPIAGSKTARIYLLDFIIIMGHPIEGMIEVLNRIIISDLTKRRRSSIIWVELLLLPLGIVAMSGKKNFLQGTPWRWQ